MTTKRWILIGAAGVSAAVVGVGTAAAESLIGGSTGDVPSTPSQVRAANRSPNRYAYTEARVGDASYRAARVTPSTDAESQYFAVLRAPSTSTMPSVLATALAKVTIETEKFGPNFAMARLLSAAGQVPEIWLVPGNDALCLYTIYSSDDGGSTCQASADVAAGKLNLTRETIAGTSMIGVAPDGVTNAVIQQPGGATRRIPVVDNLYEVPDAAGVTGVTFATN